MADSEPLVSVLTTNFNREELLKESILATLGSSYENLELVVVDDCSDDHSYATALSFAERDERVKVYRNDVNLGDYNNRNRAASLASGKYIKFVDSDDLLYPHGLAVMVATMEQFPEAGLGLAATSFESSPHPVLLNPQQTYERNYLEADLFGRAPGSAIIVREAFEAVGGFSGINQVGDHEFWAKIARYYPTVTLPRDLVWDRVHGDQEQFRDGQAEKMLLHLEVDLAALAHEDCPLNLEERRLAEKQLERSVVKSAAQHLRRADYRAARRLLSGTRSNWWQLLALLSGNRE